MKATEIFEAAPGTVFFMLCDAEHRKEMVNQLCVSMPDSLKKRASLNACSVISLELCGSELPNRFQDLAFLCEKLIDSAGKRSHFEGLLLLDISDLGQRTEDEDRLRALGEILLMEGGIASRALTVLYGASEESEFIRAADCLDFNSKLRVERIEMGRMEKPLKTLLEEACASCATKEAAQAVEAALKEMRDEQTFSPIRFIQSCVLEQGVITLGSARAALDSPYSYINRFRKLKTMRVAEQEHKIRRIGFQREA